MINFTIAFTQQNYKLVIRIMNILLSLINHQMCLDCFCNSGKGISCKLFWKT